MFAPPRSLGLAAFGWFLASRGRSEPLRESLSRLDGEGAAELMKAGRTAAIVAVKELAAALRYAGTGMTPPPVSPKGAPAEMAWVDRLEVALALPAADARLDDGLTRSAEDFNFLLETNSPKERAIKLAARLAEYLGELIDPEGAPTALDSFLIYGWPWTTSEDQPVTFLELWQAAFCDALDTAPAYVTSPFCALGEFRAWLASPLGIGRFPETELKFDTEQISRLGHKPPKFRGFWLVAAQSIWIGLFVFLLWQCGKARRSEPSPPPSLSPTPSTPTAVVLPTPSPEPPPPPPSALVEPAAPVSAATPEPTSVAVPDPGPALAELSLSELSARALRLTEAGDHEQVVPVWRQIIALHEKKPNTTVQPRAMALARLASALAALGRWEEADAAVEKAQGILDRAFAIHDANIAMTYETLGGYWADRNLWPLAARAFQQAVRAYEKTPQENSVTQLAAINRLAGALRQIGETNRAEQLYRRLVKSYDGSGLVVAHEAASAHHNLANLLLTTDRPGEARGFYERAFALLAKTPAEDSSSTAMRERMAANYERCLLALGLDEETAGTKARRAVRPE
jgi:tetratricopeptide (TPR) repeat protein